ncbi:tRNA lysidine(34) synthetase TilS [Vibrio sp. 99-70-13A1]|uniref:tRNA lysidine(34) synthetase TilS n=1 Tax=Vibrio sp. 99-70-13A1 TaxID=2607601 RepID=UPI00149365FE|nr:tRNA lysidine(34) synthetase TilS [Vibrio sp. 99-70-13A1]NOH98480.1 tRNA lysidine(34) synthetase TilS [Vibrio sp. 99-70-13A1]
MSSLFEKFTSVMQLANHQPKRVVIAFSGGVDSRVLLELSSIYQKTFPSIAVIAVHVHHGLSANADEWAQQCSTWCEQLGISFAVEKVTLDQSSSESLEKLARDARYQVLSQYLENGDFLLTGQHSDDQVETFLLALKRGSGPKGLSSMAQIMPFGDAFLVRPLLSASRTDIEAFAHQQGLSWVEDESNTDLRFDRNFIRHEISPRFQQRWPSFSASVQRSALLCAEQEQLLDELLASQFSQAYHLDQSLDITFLKNQTELLRARLIRMWLAKLSLTMPSRKQLQLIWDEVAEAKHDANPRLILDSVEIRRYSGRLYAVKNAKDITNWSQSISLNELILLPERIGSMCLQTDEKKFAEHEMNSVGMLSLDVMKNVECLRVIFNPEGLVAHPVGRNHSRKMKKLFQEYNVPSWLRRRTPIVMDGENVVAVLGVFVDQRYQGQDCEVLWSK